MEFNFTSLNDQTRPLWDDFVATHPWAWPGQDSAIVDFEISRGARSLSLLALDNQGRVAAVSPLFASERTRSRLIRVRALNTGQSLRGAPLLRADLSKKDQDRFWQAWNAQLLELVSEHHIDIINIGFPHLFGDRYVREIFPYMPLMDFDYKPSGNQTMIKDLAACNGDLMDSVTPVCRKSIRRARSAGALCRLVSKRETWLDFYSLNEETFRDEPFEAYSRQTMEIIWDRFVARGLAYVFAIETEEGCIGTVVTCGSSHSQYLWVGFNRRPRPLPGSYNCLLFYAMDWLREQGVRFIEIGSLEFDDPRQKNIARFKQSFGGTVYPSMDGSLTVSELKMATVGWLQALSRRLHKRTPLQSHLD